MHHRLLASALLLAPAALHAQEPSAPPALEVQAEKAVWAFEASDIAFDPEYRFGQLANGMRYIIRQNDRPEGTALVRMAIGSGSLAETDSEQGLAHFLEHMAFNGSTNVPEGEMIKLLEREGLAFGADTNASTGFETTTYKLDLPRNDPALLSTALMLMRETASELTIDPDAVDRERGVILSERRDRTNYAQKDQLDQFEFFTPGARYTKRLPIGTLEVLTTATADDIRGYYAREYVPANTVLAIIGDFDADLFEAAITERFESWVPAELPQEPQTGPVDLGRSGVTDIYLDPALSERVIAARHTVWIDEPDSIHTRRQNLLRSIGYGIVNRRLQTLARSEDAPFRGAGFGTSNLFEMGRTTNLVVDSADGQWAKGLDVAAVTLRRALAYGFTQAEVAEQLAGVLTAQQNAAASANTRGNGALMAGALALVSDDIVPSTAQSGLDRLEAFIPYITPAVVLAALQADATPLDNPMIRFRGSKAPAGGKDGLRSVWQAAMIKQIEPLAEVATIPFAYGNFGAPGTVVSDEVEPQLGIRKIRFDNGVRLNLKQTDLQADRIAFELNVDGGSLLDTEQDPLATAMVSALPGGGLGKHSQDELQSILAGRSVSWGLSTGADSFTVAGTTTARDLELQLQLLTAGLTDPGYRKEAEAQYRRGVANFFKGKDATPNSALRFALGGITSDNNPRFTFQSEDSYLALSFAQLRAAIGDRFEKGALEVALVGDIDEQTAIALVASTFGALPPRETDFMPRTEARERSFTKDLTPRVLTHQGEADQALLRITWPTVDQSDLTQDIRLMVLERIVRLELQAELRERLGKTYSPSASSNTSRHYTGYGTFAIAASVDAGDVSATRSAIDAAITRLRNAPVEVDTLDRARRPLLESYDNILKSNRGWIGLVDRAQSEAERIDRYLQFREVVEAVTPADIQITTGRFLRPDAALEILVVPEGQKPS